MRYFTPERWLGLQHVPDATTFTAVYGEWERAIADYEEELSRILPRLPVRLRHFAEKESLHDGAVLACWGEGERLTILVRPDSPGERLVSLAYTLVAAPVIRRDVLPAEHRGQPRWMYDEFGMEAGESADVPVFTHDILLHNGWALSLRFRELDVAEAPALLPVLSTGQLRLSSAC
jgi:hypothetical protein